MNILNSSIEFLKGIGPTRFRVMQDELKIFNYNDLINYFPIRYIDRTRFYNLNDLPRSTSEIQLTGKIINYSIKKQFKRKILIAELESNNQKINLVWFRGYKWVIDKLKINEKYVVFGKLNWFKNTPSLVHPEFVLQHLFIKEKQLKIYPLYSIPEELVSKGITQKVFRNSIENLFFKITNNLVETIPDYIIRKYNLIGRNIALSNIHFPKNHDILNKSIYRLKFEELFFFQIKLIRNKRIKKDKIKGLVFKKVGYYFNKFYKNNLSFDLTNDQKRAIKEIRYDMATGKHMNRLLQGDVGSGKTIVAFMTSLIAIDNNFQACLMAPTEILAIQHYKSIKKSSQNLNLNISLLTGSTKKKEREEINIELKNGNINLIVGTHTLIEEKIIFKNLGLAIIDEQHRFGVAQRSRLWKKNLIPPHILIMSATPIPRTLSMTLYGDVDISSIKELPPGRKKIKTYLRSDSKRLNVFKFISSQIKKGRQIYIVYPLIEESKKMDYKDLMDGFESISRYFPLPKFRISIVHGRMKSKDKDYEMERFVNGKTQIMVATTVIEVGVNVPNASVILIESAERFGLSQLHQLRGRVGRGDHQSYCILMSSNQLSDDSKKRLNTMVEYSDGFKIADVDLKLRGPGDVSGTKQSGLIKFKIVDILGDQELVKITRELAIEILNKDPELLNKNNLNLNRVYKSIYKGEKNIWNYIS